MGVKKIAIRDIVNNIIANNGFLSQTYFGNNIGEYLVFFIIVCGGFVLARLFYWMVQKFVKAAAARTKSDLDDILVDMLEEPAMVYVFWFFSNLAWRALDFTEYPQIDVYFGHIMYTIVALNTAWLISRVIISLIDAYIKPMAAKSKTDLDDYLLPILTKVINIVVFGIAIIMILGHFGQEIGPMLAGLGIGGLAFALAAKDLLSNLFGSLTVIFDKPFAIGDRIKIDGYDGSVQEINLRTTRIKTLDGTIIYVPNSNFTTGIVENVTQEWARKVKMTIGLTYDTPAKKMETAKKHIVDIIKKHKGIDSENFLVNFTEFGAFSKDILVIYWITDKENIFPIRDEVNFKIMLALEKDGIDMAFPTQTIELKK